MLVSHKLQNRGERKCGLDFARFWKCDRSYFQTGGERILPNRKNVERASQRDSELVLL